MAATVIVNPSAGGGRAAKLLPALREAARAAGDVDVVVSDSPGHPEVLAKEALDQERVVVAAGGDGLVGVVAGAVHEAGGVLGVVPIGSGNDYARHLGLHLRHPLDALAVVADGHEAVLDAGRAAGKLFCTVAASGFDAEAARWARGITRLRGTPLYVAAVARTLWRYRPQPFTVRVDGEERRVDAWMVAVGVTPNYAGGMRVAPAADTADGLLDVTIVGAVGRGEFVRTFPKVFSGRHVDHPMVTVARGAVVELDAPGLEVWADGEPAGAFPATVAAVPAALRVLVPAGSHLRRAR
jgi:YegS/Rv2252/BmrU family lipid kinase